MNSPDSSRRSRASNNLTSRSHPQPDRVDRRVIASRVGFDGFCTLALPSLAKLREGVSSLPLRIPPLSWPWHSYHRKVTPMYNSVTEELNDIIGDARESRSNYKHSTHSASITT